MRAAPTLAAATANAPLELAPSELRKQLDTLRHTQGELLLAKQAAEAAMMAKGEFLATMSHEIRTPLNGVLPLLELVLATPLAPDQRDYLSTAHASARELLRIVDAILDYSKLDAERLELETTGLNLRELVGGVAQLMQRNAEAKGLRLTVTIDPNVRLAVRGDPVRLRQVLTNLVSNAIKFTERGGVHIQVSKRAETREHHEIVFAVRDSGIGIAPDVAAKLFRPFSQADASTTRVFGGTGLGLAICKRLVDLMRGHLGVKSEPGKGSLFWFSVPLLEGRRRPASAAQSRRHSRAGARRRRRAAATSAECGIDARHRGHAGALARRRAVGPSREREHGRALAPRGAFHRCGSVQAGHRDARAQCAQGHGARTRAHPGFRLRRQRSSAGSAPARAVRQHHRRDAAHDARADVRRAGTRLRARASLPPKPSCSSARATANAVLRGRVLLVEDNAVNQRVAQRLLDLHGLDVTAVNDGREAVGRLERERYDLVLMDCLMPVMDGYMATRLWRERERAAGNGHVPIVAMTANAMAGDRERCLASGMDDYLSKPLDRAALVQMLRRWLPQTEAQDAPAVSAAPHPSSHAPRVEAPAPVRSQAPIAAPDASRMTALDAVVISDLLDTMGGEFGDLVRVYLEDAPQRLRELEAGAETGDASAQVAPAHTLKSSSANIGAMGLSDLAQGHRARGARRHRDDAGRNRGRHASRVRACRDGAQRAPGSRRDVRRRIARQLSTLVCRYGTTPSSSTSPSCVSSQSMCSSSDSRMLEKRSRLT